MKKSTKKNILENGVCGCPIPYEHILRISYAVKKHYSFSAPEFWMWKMFQFGYAYGKGKK